MLKPRKFLTASVAAITVCVASGLITACGSSTHHETRTTATHQQHHKPSLLSPASLGLIVFKSRYVHAVKPAVPVAKHIVSVLHEGSRPRTTRWFAQRFSALATKLGPIDRRLHKLKPPPAVAAAFRRYLDSLDAIDRDLIVIAHNAKLDNPAKIRASARSLVRDISRSAAPNGALNRRLGVTRL